MKPLKVLVVCAAGMSTSLLVEAMKRAAAEQRVEAEISAVSASELSARLGTNPGGGSKTAEVVLAVLVAPQMRHRFAQLSEMAGKAGAAAGLIEARVYGTMDGQAALRQALEAARRRAGDG